MTDKPNYKAGGTVTVKIDEQDADNFRDGELTYILPDQILSYTPPAEPIVYFVNVYKSGVAGSTCTTEEQADYVAVDDKRLFCIKHTVDPTTGECKSEVVR